MKIKTAAPLFLGFQNVDDDWVGIKKAVKKPSDQ